MLTDPARGRRTNPGDPDVCNLFPMHKIYSPTEMQGEEDEVLAVAGESPYKKKSSKGNLVFLIIGITIGLVTCVVVFQMWKRLNPDTKNSGQGEKSPARYSLGALLQ